MIIIDIFLLFNVFLYLWHVGLRIGISPLTQKAEFLNIILEAVPQRENSQIMTDFALEVRNSEVCWKCLTQDIMQDLHVSRTFNFSNENQMFPINPFYGKILLALISLSWG